MARYVLPDLDYDYGALAPHISAEITSRMMRAFSRAQASDDTMLNGLSRSQVMKS